MSQLQTQQRMTSQVTNYVTQNTNL